MIKIICIHINGAVSISDPMTLDKARIKAKEIFANNDIISFTAIQQEHDRWDSNWSVISDHQK